MTWHTYFDKNNVQDWSIYGFHKNWILIYEQEYENLIYDKAVDTLVKSLHEIIAVVHNIGGSTFSHFSEFF
ncbi:hypothetical protein C2G38_2256807 [Gigaspora rosea]|uniref:Uncharacterized protein n=1 Tax=Gigaspora rosea TaxID=44941 RepID=A0A397TV28_9GLOM|nr:hypothetical protein C2G38_2256807 [Gigaspora rosea]